MTLLVEAVLLMNIPVVSVSEDSASVPLLSVVVLVLPLTKLLVKV